MARGTIRQARPEDMPQIKELNGEIEMLLGVPMGSTDLPDVSDPAILDYVVVEKDGEAIGGEYQEKSIEYCQFGVHPEATAAIRERLDEVFRAARLAGIRFVHCHVPKQLDPQVGKHLMKSGFEPTDFVHYRLDLSTKE